MTAAGIRITSPTVSNFRVISARAFVADARAWSRDRRHSTAPGREGQRCVRPLPARSTWTTPCRQRIQCCDRQASTLSRHSFGGIHGTILLTSKAQQIEPRTSANDLPYTLPGGAIEESAHIPDQHRHPGAAAPFAVPAQIQIAVFFASDGTLVSIPMGPPRSSRCPSCRHCRKR